MKKIYKYQLRFYENTCVIPLPKDSILLSFQEQNNVVCAWVMFDEDFKVLEPKTFIGFTTGERFEMSDDMVYRATVKLNGGLFIFHIFEKTK